MSSILSDIEYTLSNKELGNHLLKKYEEYLPSILGVHIKFENDIPYFEIDHCKEGICIIDAAKYRIEDTDRRRYQIPTWMEFKAKSNKRRDKLGYTSFCKLYTGNSGWPILFCDWDDEYPNMWAQAKTFKNVMISISFDRSPNYFKQKQSRKIEHNHKDNFYI